MPDRFELLERLGKGGMGTVWKARDRVTGEIVALKVIHAQYADEPDYVARFEREVEVAQRIDSPHVVKVSGYGQQDGLPYMAMEYVEGQSLKELLKARGKLSWEEAKPLLLHLSWSYEGQPPDGFHIYYYRRDCSTGETLTRLVATVGPVDREWTYGNRDDQGGPGCYANSYMVAAFNSTGDSQLAWGVARR